MSFALGPVPGSKSRERRKTEPTSERAEDGFSHDLYAAAAVSTAAVE